MDFNDVRLRYESLRDEIDNAIGSVLSGGCYILGPLVETFEDEFARYCGAARGVGVGRGPIAKKTGLGAGAARGGDAFLAPAVSAAATGMSVAAMGARPVFVDISLDDFNILPEQCLERKTSRTKAVIPVHLYGMPARLKEIGKAGLPILEDAAQAHGSDASWGRCGSFGVAAAFSFYPTKNLATYGDGGILVTSDATIAEASRLLRNYGQRENYSSKILGKNSRLDELHAAILRLNLRRLDEWNGRRRAIAEKYREAFRELSRTFPSSQRRGGRDTNKISRSHLNWSGRGGQLGETRPFRSSIEASPCRARASRQPVCAANERRYP